MRLPIRGFGVVMPESVQALNTINNEVKRETPSQAIWKRFHRQAAGRWGLRLVVVLLVGGGVCAVNGE